ncbi:hypothetical protein GIB67_005727 [Kingdonia uniflora]|uniref:Uncharacterized protein n=1 Tax=Kingdonia uniflora TaxID=39325 RepID=A0A7J7KVE7_9MAGN|nr:hypothetical protein GIB67_005727 [Kingdonia uniflora]
MHMLEGDPYPSTMSGFRGTRDPKSFITRSRSGRKKKRVKFEVLQPKPNSRKLPAEVYYPNRDSMRVHGTFTTVIKVWKEISTIPPVRDAVVNILGQFIKISLGNSYNQLIQTLKEREGLAEFLDCEKFVVGEGRETYALYWAEQTLEVGRMLTDSQKMGNIDLLESTALRAGITPMVVTSVSVHSISQDFSLPSEAEGPDPGWYMEWTGRREMFPIAHLRDPPPMSSSYDAEELWHLTHGIRRLVLVESVRDALRLQELTDENDTPKKNLDSVDEQLYAHDLQLRRGCDVRVVQRPPGGGARTRQCGSGLRTREGDTSRRGWGTGDDSE